MCLGYTPCEVTGTGVHLVVGAPTGLALPEEPEGRSAAASRRHGACNGRPMRSVLVLVAVLAIGCSEPDAVPVAPEPCVTLSCVHSLGQWSCQRACSGCLDTRAALTGASACPAR
jgi:hypothetical protein